MKIKDYENYSVIIKTEDGSKELLRTKGCTNLKGEDVIVVRCEEGTFENIARVIVILHHDEEVYQFKGTVRHVHYEAEGVEIALYHGEEIHHRSHIRFEAKTRIHVIRCIDFEGDEKEVECLEAEMIDISNNGVGFIAGHSAYERGDKCSFTIHNKIINRVLYAEVVRITSLDTEKSKYGCILLDNEEANACGLTGAPGVIKKKEKIEPPAPVEETTTPTDDLSDKASEEIPEQH